LAFPAIIVLHTVGMGFLVGTNLAIDLRILGFAPRMPLAPLEGFFPVMWLAFVVNALSGVALLIAYPAKALTNPVFYVKLACIALGVAGMRLLKKQVFRDPRLGEGPVPMKGKIVAGASVLLWLGTITAGRLLAYTYVRLMSSD
jgi:hypothetical protein